MKFKLKQAPVSVRGEVITVREITHAERLQWIRTGQDDRFRGPALLVSLGSVEPAFTEEQAGELPNDVVDALVEKIMELSELKTKKSDAKGGKEEKKAESGGEA